MKGMKGMRQAISIFVAAAVLFPRVCVASLPPGVLLWDMERRQEAPSRLWLHRRDDGDDQTVEEVITNERTRGGYFSTVRVGSPFQEVTLQLDTGSSDVWVPSSRAPRCSLLLDPNACPLGSFDETGSSTFETFLPGDFNIAYLDQSFSEGDYFTDRIEIGGATVEKYPMGLGLNTSIPHGLLGLGYTLNEVSIPNNGTEYDNLPVALAREGIVNSVAYSLWLNDLDSSTGNVLFGGVDSEKYVGDMIRINVLPDEKAGGLFTHFAVAMTSLDAKSPTGEDKLSSVAYPIEVILDAGTTMTFLPTDVVDQVWEEAGVEFNDFLGVGLIPCSRRSSPGVFAFGFGGPGGPQVEVGMDELILDLLVGEQPPFPPDSRYKGQDACQFGIQPFSDAPFILGDTFLRSAYVVYDLVNNEIGLAQTDFNETGSSIVAFESNGSSIPMSSAAPNQDDLESAASLDVPEYAARDGFQSHGWMAAVHVSAWMVVGLAVLHLL